MKERNDPWRGESYHGQPPLKNPHWDWKVSGYIAVAATAGAAQTLAWVGTLRDRRAFRGARRNASLVGVAGTAIGVALLIVDLKTPARFYNMIRILRPTSPMSFGTYILGAFGLASAGSALGDLSGGEGRLLPRIANVAQAGAAITGAGAATYTAALMSATSNPYWAVAPRALGASFATSAIASGAAVLALGERLGGRPRIAERLEAVAAVASAAHAVTKPAYKIARRKAGVETTISRQGRRLETADLLIAGAAPLVGYGLNWATGGRMPGAAIAASLAVLAGGALLRHGILESGKKAARRPEAAFALAQPRNLPLSGRGQKLGR